MALIFPEDDVGTEQSTLEILAALVAANAPGVTVEAGTYKGHFAENAVAVSRHTARTRVFTADTIDHGYRPTNEWIEDYRGDFEDMLFVLDINHVDFAFIDSGPPFAKGEEFERGVRKRHYDAVKQRMVSGGVICCHDTNSTDWFGADEIIANATIRITSGRGLTVEVL
jgi:hypothetical protein